MGYGIFLHRMDSIYDDKLEECYQFPRQYLKRVQDCVGDWIVYLEPSKVRGSRGYFATAKVQQVIPDPQTPNMYLALIEPGTYLPFVNPLPFRGPGGVTETGVETAEGRISGRAQWAVRPLSAADFNRIIDRGLDAEEGLLPQIGGSPSEPELHERQTPFEFDKNHDRSRFLTSRLIRDRVFRQVVLTAYDSRCVVSGLRLINGGGRAEVEAAHIRPVGAHGPDIVSNGLALSGTTHWMFDRGLIGIADDLSILISRHVNDAESVTTLINHSGRILPPQRDADRPHRRFLQWHRENCFKG